MKPFEQATQAELRALWESQQPTQTEIVPAKPLTDPLGVGDQYWLCEVSRDIVCKETWDGSHSDYVWLIDQRIFPPTPEGKLGAELRAKRGFIPHPGMDWQEDVQLLRDHMDQLSTNSTRSIPILRMLESFLNKYS